MSVSWRWLGRVPYEAGLRWQRDRREEVLGGGGEVLALLEHPRVVTVGRRRVAGLERVAAAGIPIVKTERGGLATWHGPGQLVGYPIINVGQRKIRVKDFVWGLEQGVVDWLRDRGVPACRRPGFPGVWVGSDKICAVGTHFRRGVSMHGFALNLAVEGDDFRLFTPCGIADAGVTSAHHHGVAEVPGTAASSVAASVLQYVDTPARREYTSVTEDT